MYETSCNALVNSCSSSILTSNITFHFYFAFAKFRFLGNKSKYHIFSLIRRSIFQGKFA